jgi:folate-dependent phosphoribosylglycinamide formyltransferase PurN
VDWDVISITKKIIKVKEHEWAKYTESVQLAVNSRVAALHGSTTFTVLCGRKCNLFKDFREQIQAMATEEEIVKRVDQLQHLFYPAVVKKVEAGQKHMQE